MRLILVAITIALFAGSLNALPSGHLRFERSTEAKAGTAVTIEKVEKAAEAPKDAAAAAPAAKAAQAAPAAAAASAPAAATETKTVESKEPINIQEAINLVKKTVQKIETENSAAEAPEASKIEQPAAAAAATATKTETAVNKEELKGESISSSASIISVPEAPTLGSIDTNDEATFSAYSQKYVNKYGDILNRINKDKVHQLKSSRNSDHRDYSRHLSRDNRQQKSKNLSSYHNQPHQKHGVSNSMSSVFINGQKFEGNSFAPKKLTHFDRYMANPYGGESVGLLSRQKGRHNVRQPTNQWNNVRVLSFQPQGAPIRFF